MLYIHSFSAITSIISLLVTGGFTDALAFCTAHPAFVIDAGFLSGAAVGGQFFIYSMVKEFGALAFAATMNVRQVASICVSYAMYAKPITALQIGGLVIVFSALFYKSIVGLMKSREDKSEGRSLLPEREPARERAEGQA